MISSYSVSMEEIMMTKKKLQTSPNPLSASQPLSIHKHSQTISKTKPKIRIIHIFAPEIIKTDVANFRELVQRLTGKPAEAVHCKKKKSSQQRVSRREESKMNMSNTSDFQDKERVKEEEEEEGMWIAENSGGFLERFADLEGFIQELGDEFPLLPLDTSHMHHGLI